MSLGDLTEDGSFPNHSRSGSYDSDGVMGEKPRELVRAMYDSDGSTNGVTVVFSEGDIFRVVQRPGDGWVEVMMKNRARAFVPESWVETVSAAEYGTQRKRSLASASILSEDAPSESSTTSAACADTSSSASASAPPALPHRPHHRRTHSHAVAADALPDVLEDVTSGTSSGDALTAHAKEGPLERKVIVEGGKKLKKRGWTSVHAVLLTTGHLHLYKEEKDRRKGRKPLHSLHLAEESISATATEHKKRRMVIHVGSEADSFMLHNTSDSELQEWFDLFALACDGKLPLEADADFAESFSGPTDAGSKRTSLDLGSSMRNRSNSLKDKEKEKEREKEKKETEKKEKKEREKAEKEKEKEKKEEEKRKRKTSTNTAPTNLDDIGSAAQPLPSTPNERGHTRTPSTPIAIDPALAGPKVSNFKWLGNFLKARPKLEDLRRKGLIQNSVFGAELSEQIRREGEAIPIIVQKCVAYIEEKALDVVGIYRMSANALLVQKTAVLFNEDSRKADVSTLVDPHAVAAILKQYFRELSDPIFTDILYPRFMEVGRISDYNERLMATRTVVISLPLSYFTTVKFVFEHLKRVADKGDVNKMHANNLGIVFGPTLLRPVVPTAESIIQDTPYQCRIIEEMILNQEWFFN